MKIKINKKNIEVKCSIRSYIVFETLTQKPFAIINTTDWYLFVYSCIMASNPDLNLTFDSFLDWVDGNKKEYIEVSQYLTSMLEVEKQYIEEVEGSKKK